MNYFFWVKAYGFLLFPKGRKKIPPSILIEMLPGKEVLPSNSYFFLMLIATILFTFDSGAAVTWSGRLFQL